VRVVWSPSALRDIHHIYNYITRFNRRAAEDLARANGGGLSYMHSGMYDMYALQESVRQMRGTAQAQIPGAKISGLPSRRGMFAASGTIIMSSEPP